MDEDDEMDDVVSRLHQIDPGPQRMRARSGGGGGGGGRSPISLTEPTYRRAKRQTVTLGLGRFWFIHTGWKYTHTCSLLSYLLTWAVLLLQCNIPLFSFTHQSLEYLVFFSGSCTYRGNTSLSQSELRRVCHAIGQDLSTTTFYVYFMYLTVFQVLLIMSCVWVAGWEYCTASRTKRFCLQQARLVFDVILLLCSAWRCFILASVSHRASFKLDGELVGFAVRWAMELTWANCLLHVPVVCESATVFALCNSLSSAQLLFGHMELHQILLPTSRI